MINNGKPLFSFLNNLFGRSRQEKNYMRHLLELDFDFVMPNASGAGNQ